MAKGRKYPDDVKEKAYHTYAVCGSYEETARLLGLPASTVTGWIKAHARDAPDEYAKLRDEKKRDFIEQASSIIDKGLTLLDRRISRALEQERELDDVIRSIGLSADISDKQRDMLVRKVEELKLYDIRALTTAVGTLYDKRALAKGESTENTRVTFTLPKELDDYAD